jgi:hypothetical protein
MNSFMRKIWLSGVLLAGCAVLAPTLRAQNISTVSPFLPRGGAGAGAATPNSPIELRGIMAAPEGTLFGLFDPVQKKGGWVKLNEAGRDFLVRTYDAANDAVTVEYQGRTLNLALKSAKIEAMPAVALAGPPRPAAGPQAGPTPSVDDTKRIEAVAAEVARRRQARQAAAQQQPQPPPPQQPQPNRQR